MKVRLSKVAVHQTSKILSLVQSVFMAFFLIPSAVFLFVTGEAVSGLMMLFTLLMFMVLFYVCFAVTLWIYNLVANSFGGVEFTVSEQHNVIEKVE